MEKTIDTTSISANNAPMQNSNQKLITPTVTMRTVCIQALTKRKSFWQLWRKDLDSFTRFLLWWSTAVSHSCIFGLFSSVVFCRFLTLTSSSNFEINSKLPFLSLQVKINYFHFFMNLEKCFQLRNSLFQVKIKLRNLIKNWISRVYKHHITSVMT